MASFYASLFMPLGEEWRVAYMLMRLGALIVSGSSVWFMFRHWQRNPNLWQLWLLVVANLGVASYYLIRLIGRNFEYLLPSTLQILLNLSVTLLGVGVILIVDQLIVTRMQRNSEHKKRNTSTVALRRLRQRK